MPLALELALEPRPLAELALEALPLLELAREDARDDALDPDLADPDLIIWKPKKID